MALLSISSEMVVWLFLVWWLCGYF